MKLYCDKVMCTAVNEPRSWTLDNGREGVTYKVELSDGSSNIQLACKNIDVYQEFIPFDYYSVVIELAQTNFEGRVGTKAQIGYAEKIEQG